MAKKQSFGDKVNKGSEKGSLKLVKVIRAFRSKETNSLKFNELILAIHGDKNPDAAVKEFLNK